MLRIVQSSSAAGAKNYYTTADYYTEGQELVGVWRGQAAERLGLSGTIELAQWDALCDNRSPQTGQALTQRRRADRRIGYDFNFHVPKSVSLLYALSGDERILTAFRGAVDDTMSDMEAEAQTRVRSRARDEDRLTANLVWGEFVHQTARPIGGVPDPHLHAHCFVFNATFDDHEQRWKAAQLGSIKRDAPYFEALFHARLSERLMDSGIPVVRTRLGWEVEGIEAATLRKFSRRTALIEAAARAKGIVAGAEKWELGAKTRERKASDLSMPALRELWRERLTEEERAGLDARVQNIGRPCEWLPTRGAAAAAVDRAAEHCFERKAVLPERELLAQALRLGITGTRPEAVIAEFGQRPWLAATRCGRSFVTTREVLAEEQRMLDFARNGRGSCAPLSPGEHHHFSRDWLNADQKAAVRHVLGSPDRVILVRGAAGTGKTTMMQEAVAGIQAAGRKVFTFAPSADASRGVLRNEGFSNAETVSRLLADPALQSDVRGQVIWVDEAGLLGSRSMGQLFDLADRADARVILSGDRRQHGSVERGAPLRLLETEAGLVAAEVREIQRQKGAYKQVVAALAEGRVADGFRQLDRMGWIREVPAMERYKLLASDYVEAVSAGKSALVVAPTHREGECVTGEIRNALKQGGRIAGDERTVPVLAPLHLTTAERGDAASLVPGDVVEFHQNAPGIRKGQRLVAGRDAVPLEQAARFSVFQAAEVRLAPGDLIRITRNGKTADGKHRLNNGATYRLTGFGREGELLLENGWRIGRDYGHLTYGYVTTSHAAQGKTVQRVFIAQSALSRGASSREQFYVSVSRGKEQAIVYTDDKSGLRDAVLAPDERPTAAEFVRDRTARAMLIQQQTEPMRDSALARRSNRPDRELLLDG